jgi:hypothetical protein
MLWALNVALLVGACTWILLDGRFGRTASLLGGATIFGLKAGEIDPVIDDVSDWRFLGVRTLSLAVIVTLTNLFFALIFGPAKFRRVRSWLALTALVAGWLALAVGWPDLAWQGKQWRLARQIEAFEPAAASLRQDWPADDGRREAVGAFMAYPQPNPTMLLLLAPPEDDGAKRLFSAVERSPEGALRFELMGGDEGDWLEWHPAGSVPQSFMGGLQGDYQLRRTAPLRDGWHVSRYRSAGPTEAP